MAQGLDLKSWNGDKSPPMENKSGDSVKRMRSTGSRRIFLPQFKLQVLYSYRNDVDCRGNQRATARKYNIHRRQIQKWLQCEQHLKTFVEESSKNENVNSSGQKSRKKIESQESKDLTLNQSAVEIRRLDDAGKVKVRSVLKQENKVNCESQIKPEAQNLKRVAQKLYPSLNGISCAQEEAIVYPNVGVDGQKLNQGDDSGRFNSISGPNHMRDNNFNHVTRTDDRVLDLKSKVRSEILPEEFLFSNVEKFLPDKDFYKLRIEEQDDGSKLASSNENIGGQKLSVSKAVLKCLIQKYTDDVSGREFCAENTKNNKLLCSHGVNCTESSCLLDIQVPKKSNSVPYLHASTVNKNLDEGEKTANVASDLNVSSDGFGIDSCLKKSKTSNLIDCSKSFNPKRKWIKESMQEMLGEEDQSSEIPSLPIKQRVKMNLRSLPEATYTLENKTQSRVGPSNFSVERLCSTNCTKDVESENLTQSKLSPSGYDTSEVTPLVLSNVGNISNQCKLEGASSEFRSCSPIESSLNLPMKEEKISDNEDMDVDIMSTTPIEKKSFDFSNYNFGKRRSFSVQFKLTVLDAFYNDKDCNKNQRATARKFNINRRQVQKWLSQESHLRSEGSVKNGKYLQRQRLGGETRDGADGCTQCPQHCIRKRTEVETFDKTIEVNVKHCSDNECLSRRSNFNSDNPTTVLSDSIDFYSKSSFQSDLTTAKFYQNYLFPENNNLIYHDSFLGWPHLSSSALAVPNFQYLSTWHHNFDFCPEKQKIY